MKFFPGAAALILTAGMTCADPLPATEVAALPVTTDAGEITEISARDRIDPAQVDHNVKETMKTSLLLMMMLADLAKSH